MGEAAEALPGKSMLVGDLEQARRLGAVAGYAAGLAKLAERHMAAEIAENHRQ